MTQVTLTKTVLISLLSHITFFGFFSFSFGSRGLATDYACINFFGQILQKSQVARPQASVRVREEARIGPEIQALAPRGKTADFNLASGFHLKPASAITANAEKLPFAEKLNPKPLFFKRTEPAIIFHPLLPYGFTLYFRDRQVAHVELAFRELEQDKRKSVMVKRKVSSGNLEVDLLSLRYIERYLFMQPANLASPDWHTVKIDLSAKND